MLAAGETYGDISVERIIRGVDVSRSTFYRYFDDKPALLRAMAVDVTLELAEGGSDWFELAMPPRRDELAWAMERLFKTYRRHHLILRAITDAAVYDPTIRDEYAALVARATEGLRAHVLGLAALRPVLAADPERSASWLVWMLERGLYQRVSVGDDASMQAELDVIVDLLWHALYAT